MKPKEHEFTAKGSHLHFYEPHKDLIKQMQKQERNHQKLTDKHEAIILETDFTHMPKVLLARIEKKWNSLAKKLRKRLGIGNG